MGALWLYETNAFDRPDFSNPSHLTYMPWPRHASIINQIDRSDSNSRDDTTTPLTWGW